MANYFNDFPVVYYDLKKNNEKKKAVDITVRFKLLDRLKDNSTIYYEYDYQDQDRPDTIGAKYYGDAATDWVLHIVNDNIDPYYDYPLSQRNFEKFIVDKYGSVSAAQSQVHHYEQIIQAETTTSDGTIVPEVNCEVDIQTYASLAPANRRKVTMYTYEDELNESKRSIKLLDKRYLGQFLDEKEIVLDS